MMNELYYKGSKEKGLFANPLFVWCLLLKEKKKQSRNAENKDDIFFAFHFINSQSLPDILQIEPITGTLIIELNTKMKSLGDFNVNNQTNKSENEHVQSNI